MKKISVSYYMLLFLAAFIFGCQLPAGAEEGFAKDQAFMVEQGDKAYEQGLYEGAVTNWQNALKINPKAKTNDLLQVRIGLGYFALGKDEQAKKAFNEALKINPNNLEAYYNLGELARKNQDFLEMEKCYQKLLELKSDEEFYFTYGLIKLRLGKKAEAAAAFENVVKINPANIGAVFNLGAIYYDQKDYAMAKDYWAKAYKMDSQNSNYAYYLALAHYSLGEKKEAADYCKKALKLDKDNKKAEQLLALINKKK